MYTLSNRRGFALPLTILVLTVVTVGLAAGFTLITSERRTINDQQAQARALGIAQQGLDLYLRHPENPTFRPGRPIHLPPWDNDTAWVPVNTTGDTAIVIPRLLRVSTLATVDTLYVISSLGFQGGGVVAGTPKARRAVSEVATWAGADLTVKAGWLSLTGVEKNGVSGTLSGIDASSPACASAGNIAGVSVPTLVAGQPGYQGSTAPLSGNPPLDNTSLGGTPQSGANVLAQTGLDWARWADGLGLPNVWRISDHGGAFPSFSDPDYYPIVYVDADLPDLPSGRGLLVVSGNLTINGSTQWNGIVMVGGGVVANGNNNVQGAVFSGLNVMIDPLAPVPIASLGNGTKTIQYNSCEVKKALQGTKALVPRRGTWADNWATY
jgi:hypothetical protein